MSAANEILYITSLCFAAYKQTIHTRKQFKRYHRRHGEKWAVFIYFQSCSVVVAVCYCWLDVFFLRHVYFVRLLRTHFFLVSRHAVLSFTHTNTHTYSVRLTHTIALKCHCPDSFVHSSYRQSLNNILRHIAMKRSFGSAR